ncbi:MAG: hypothetical protein JXN59_14045 [Anaerolineae bacterium]|nr:hypothetical protein [Anaerolineae bacterium]
MANKAVFFMGLLLALLSVGGIFYFGQVVSPPPVLVMAARTDLAAGTALSDLPDTNFVRLPLRGDAVLLSSLVTEAEYTRLREAGAVLRETVRAYEPLRKSALVSSANDAAARLPALALSDPNRMIVRLVVTDNAPEVHAGDLVDLSLAVSDLQTRTQVESVLAVPPVNASAPFLPPGVNGLSSGPVPTPTASPTPTVTPTPALLAPMAKVIVHAAVVTHIVREQPILTGTSPDPAPINNGKIIAMDVVIPRPAFEVVSMANAAGRLEIGLLSPLADRTDGPTMGASLSDFINQFYADRAKITAQPASVPATGGQASATAMLPPTITPSPTIQP